MRSAKSIIVKKIRKPHFSNLSLGINLFCLLAGIFYASIQFTYAQDNSPFSRYGIGDLTSVTPVNARAMGSISAGFADYRSVNFSNPASFAYFEANQEVKNKKIASGRFILDFGINIDNRTLRDKTQPQKFTAYNMLFSYVQMGMPLKRGWGLSFGLRPVSRISYKILRGQRIVNPITGNLIDSVNDRFEGDGGSYLANIGTGIKIFKKTKGQLEESLSIGINSGYYFGNRKSSTRREFKNDSVKYFAGNYETQTNYGNIYFSTGLQYILPLKKDDMIFTAGLYGSWGQYLNARQDKIRETFVFDFTLGDVRLDSVQDIKGIKGKIFIPASITGGIMLQKFASSKKENGWLIGADVAFQNWSRYRFFGQLDSLQNKLEVRVGGEIIPVPRENYFSRMAYRWGIIAGNDYIRVRGNLPQHGITLGLGLPVGNYNRLSPFQNTGVNISFEYIKRGNKDTVLRENLFRISVGFSLSDLWFFKRKYD